MHERFRDFFKVFRMNAHPMAIMVAATGSLSAYYHDNLDWSKPDDREVRQVLFFRCGVRVFSDLCDAADREDADAGGYGVQEPHRGACSVPSGWDDVRRCHVMEGGGGLWWSDMRRTFCT